MGYSVSNRVREQFDQWSQAADDLSKRGMEQAREVVAENPATSIFAAFGIGMGIGVLLTLAMPESKSRYEQFSDRVSDRFSDLGQKISSMISDHIPWAR